MASNPDDEMMWGPAALFGLFDDLFTTDSSEAGRLRTVCYMMYQISKLSTSY
jgi:hypothetical protein